MLHYQQLIDWIKASFATIKDIKGCEIGVAQARMENELVEAIPNLFIYGVDPQTPDTKHPRIEFIRKKSDDALTHFKNESLDFVYVDGDHSFAQVMKDILNYAKFVNVNGFIAGHDYHDTTHGVKAAVDKLFTPGTVVLGEDLTWKVNKRDIKW